MSWGVGQYQPHDTDTDRHARGNKERYHLTNPTTCSTLHNSYLLSYSHKLCPKHRNLHDILTRLSLPVSSAQPWVS